MTHEHASLLRKTVLATLFLAVICTFWFDFVEIKLHKVNLVFTGFDFLTCKQIGDKSMPSIWFSLVPLTAIAGFVVSLTNIRRKYNFSFLLALSGTLFLLVAQFKITIRAMGSNSEFKAMELQPAYWFCLGILVLLCCKCYLMSSRVAATEEKQQGNVLNINIITHTSNERTNNKWN